MVFSALWVVKDNQADPEHIQGLGTGAGGAGILVRPDRPLPFDAFRWLKA